MEGALFNRNIFFFCAWPHHPMCDFSKSRLQLESLHNHHHLQECHYSCHSVSLWQLSFQEVGGMELLERTAHVKKKKTKLVCYLSATGQHHSTYRESEWKPCRSIPCSPLVSWAVTVWNWAWNRPKLEEAVMQAAFWWAIPSCCVRYSCCPGQTAGKNKHNWI